MRNTLRFLTLLIACLLADVALAKDLLEETFDVQKDIEYANFNGISLLLDLYRPRDTPSPPLVVWVHGGAWRKGSKANMPLTYLLNSGFAVASVDYRLSPVAKFPAQIHDCKAAIRFLRGHSNKLTVDADRIAVVGSSAGGHIAALIGVTNDHDQLEGNIGLVDQSSSVQATIDLYGPTNFDTILAQSTPHGLSVRVPALKLLLGGVPEIEQELAKLASPVHHVTKGDPPLLIIHGDQDPQVPISQSHELHAKYKEVGTEVIFEIVHGGAHGGPQFHDERRRKLIIAFLSKHLR